MTQPLPKSHHTKNLWNTRIAYKPRPTHTHLNTRSQKQRHNISETGSASVIRWKHLKGSCSVINGRYCVVLGFLQFLLLSSPISPTVRTRPWTFITEQVPFRCFHLMTEAEPVSEMLCRCFLDALSLCAIVCLCVFCIGFCWPLCVLWFESSWVTYCYLCFFWLLVFRCVCVCVRSGRLLCGL
jgi:hypothetical protein